MKKFLPKSINNPAGFTLVELLVVISIIAILSVVAVTLFGNAQKNARDGRRRADIDAIAAALEANHVPNSNTYPALAASMFAAQAIPVDNTTAKYSVLTSTTDGAAAPGIPTAWAVGVANPTAPANYATVAVDVPAATATSWTICAHLEVSATTWYCKQSSQ